MDATLWLLDEGRFPVNADRCEIETLRKQAGIALALGRPREAVPALRRMLEIDPGDTETLARLVSQEALAGEFQSATDALLLSIPFACPERCAAMASVLAAMDRDRTRLQRLTLALLNRCPTRAAFRLADAALNGCGADSLIRDIEAIDSASELSIANDLLRALDDLPRLLVAPRLIDPQHPLWIRFGTSDLNVVRQILIETQYSCIPTMAGSSSVSIIDAGANIGVTARWFANRYRGAEIVAIEPDADSAELLRLNTTHLTDVRVIEAGLWSHPTRLALSLGADGQPWSTVAHESLDGPIQAISLESLLAAMPERRCDILKVDIEGAEEIVFRDAGRWIEAVSVVAIECHGRRAMSTVRDAIVPPLRWGGQFGEVSLFDRV